MPEEYCRPTLAVTAMGAEWVPALALAMGATMAALEDAEQLLRTVCDLASTATEAAVPSLEEGLFHKAHSEMDPWVAQSVEPSQAW